MSNISNTIVNKGGASISLGDLYKGWSVDTDSKESSIIRQYIDYKKSYPIGYDELYTDIICSEYFMLGDTVFLCIHIIEILMSANKIDDFDTDISDYINFDELILNIGDDAVVHNILLNFCRKILD